MKKYAKGGGDTDDGELSLDNLSFSKAFNAVRQWKKDRGDDPNSGTFTWRGKKYSTKMASEKSKPATQKEDLPEVTVSARTPAAQRRDAYDPLENYGRVDVDWEALSPALSPSRPRSRSAVAPTDLRGKSDYSMFDKIRQGGKPAAGYYGMRKGGGVKTYASGGSVSSASKRADGCATKGKTKGRFV